MISKILARIGTLFSTSKFGMLFAILFSKASSSIVKEILDVNNQRAAYEFVKSLHDRKDIDNLEKARLFNQKMLDRALMMGKTMQQSVVNCLRELAVNAFKAESQEK